MSGTNSLVNLPEETPILIKSYWYNEATASDEFSESTIIVPPGQYSYSTFLTFWNTYVPIFSDDPYPDTCYSFGGSPTVSPTILNPSLTKYEYNIRLLLQQYANLLDQSFLGITNEHVYKRFELILTPENYRLFCMLGFREIINPEFGQVTTLTISIDCVVESREYDIGTNTTTVTYEIDEPILADYAFDFSGTKALYVYIETPVNSQFRSPFNQNNSSNLIARVPLSAPFGFQFEFYPQHVVYSQQKNLNISQMIVTCRDEYNTFVDFQNLPWFIDLSIRFGASEDELNSSTTAGTMGSLSSTPSLHPSAQGYNSGNRDVLYNSQKNIDVNTQRSKRFRGPPVTGDIFGI